MSLPIKKVYVDTRFRTTDSISTSQFKIELPDTLALPHNTIFHLDDIAIPHSWYTVTEDVNDRLYIQVSVKQTTSPNSNTNKVCHIITIPQGNYNLSSLAHEIQTQANAWFYGVTSASSHFLITANDKTHTLTFTCVHTISAKVFTNSDIKSKLIGYVDGYGWDGSWNGIPFDSDNSKNANTLIGNYDEPGVAFSGLVQLNTQYADLQLVRNIYIHSANLGSYKTIGPQGESTIIKKVPVNANPNSMIFSSVTSSSDYLDCSRQTLKTISFELKDAHGRIINLHGANVSFSIVFDKYRSDVVN